MPPAPCRLLMRVRRRCRMYDKRLRVSDVGEDVVRRVHEASVDVAKLAEAKEVGPVLGVAEVVGRRPVDRNGACVSRGVAEGRLSCVDCQRFNVEFLVAHVVFSFLSFGREHYRTSLGH